MISASAPDYRKCYEDEYFNSGKENNGKVILKFTINKDGNVQKSKAEAESMLIVVKKCVEGVLARLKFPPVKDGGTIDISQPMIFLNKSTR